MEGLLYGLPDPVCVFCPDPVVVDMYLLVGVLVH